VFVAHKLLVAGVALQLVLASAPAPARAQAPWPVPVEDPLLASLIDEALAKNPDVAAARQAAAAAGSTPQSFADRVSGDFRRTWDRLGIGYSQYIRTTDPAHQAVVRMIRRAAVARHSGRARTARDLLSRARRVLSPAEQRGCDSDRRRRRRDGTAR